ncbi:DNA methyltransferase [Corynebacterium suedekumii]|uniref:Site-specific DNA-methyltransferase n=1 Tax=Corynebacterium suedekumii TaxID=3049801 RepID=A0ABY8VIL7_9CORY|nr:site-specific DNA-methyltransferase [Corynebacterium suedekumii]WIM69510.1 site-specific DNA-methyltransferase [Corynebacterium suedekumii]
MPASRDDVRLTWPTTPEVARPGRLSGLHRYTADGVEPVSTPAPDDNLLLRGDNLPGLRALAPLLAGSVQLIYIDPPYNTGSTDYVYADRRSRADWLSFMQARINAALPLLAPDGVFIAQCSFHQSAYLEVLLDQTPGLHKVAVLHALVRHPDRALTADKQFNDVVEQILIYSPDPAFRMPGRMKERDLSDYRWDVELTGPGRAVTLGGRACTIYPPDAWRKVDTGAGLGTFRTHSIRGSLREKNSSGRFWVAHLEGLELAPLTLIDVPGIGDDGLGHRFFHTPKPGNRNGSYFQGVPQSSSHTRLPYPNFLDVHEAYNKVTAEGGVSFRNGKKPESLLRTLIELFTDPDETVLDYHAGSGTTAAVAHKLGRRHISIEQREWAETIALARLRGVIGGEQSGISADVGWTSGGSVVYGEIG